MTYILGLNAYHGDAAACILQDGELIAAAEEERFLRIKHWAGFPERSIQYCLDHAGIKISEVDTIAVNSDPKARFFYKILHVLRYRVSLDLIKDRFFNAQKRNTILENLKRIFPNENFFGKIVKVEHHLAHLASAFLVSPYSKASVVSIDGFGDFSSGCIAVGNDNQIFMQESFLYPHSLGVFYQSITQFLGFPNYGDEYKVMGLAPYGKPKYLKEMRDILLLKDSGAYELNLKYFRFHREKVQYEWNNCSPRVGKLYSDNLIKLLGDSRTKEEPLTEFHKDIASSAQQMFEEALFHLLNKVQERHGTESICLAGGCGNNSVANGKIRKKTKYKNVYVAAAAGDAGGALGAAYYVYNKKNQRNIDNSFMKHAYIGPEFDNSSIKNILEHYSEKLPEKKFEILKFSSSQELVETVAEEISRGQIVGWFQGRMEWGPRALGNRSILGDPRRIDMKEILNEKIKRRESFRPFAPSILRESVLEWFEEVDEVPFMMKVLPFKKEKRELVPAVTHVDGSGRLQTVSKESNPLYHGLISAFKKITGVPILLNTSFNENEPVVCRPEEALNCFIRTKMDLVVINDYLIKRKEI